VKYNPQISCKLTKATEILLNLLFFCLLKVRTGNLRTTNKNGRTKSHHQPELIQHTDFQMVIANNL
jgi:hypothetical protein